MVDEIGEIKEPAPPSFADVMEVKWSPPLGKIDAMTGGAELQQISEATQQKSIDMGLNMYSEGGFLEAGKEWPMLLRQLERAGMDDYMR